MKTYIELFAGLSPLSEVLPWKKWRPALIVEKCNYVNAIREKLHPFAKEEARIEEDINDVEALPPCDLLLAGFPCQPYSTAGKKKGLSDPRALIRKTLDLIEGEPPRAVILENVRGILGPQGRETIAMISETLTRIYGGFQIVESCASDFGPMRRPRVFIVASQGGWTRPEIEAQPYHKGALKLLPESDERLSPCYLGERTLEALKAHKEKHVAKGNGFGFQAISAESASIPTISARYWKDGSEALLVEGERARRLHPIELARLFGWPSPSSTKIWDPSRGGVSFTRLARALGNSIHLGQLAWVVQGFGS
jgi:DNA (cytosine-5)-methyltransferase 1